VTFANAITQASWTRASFATLYTSRLPSSHSCITKVSALPDDVLTVAEVMSERGYATGGLPNNINVTRSFNFQQGFDYFSYQSPSYFLWGSESVAQLSMPSARTSRIIAVITSMSRFLGERHAAPMQKRVAPASLAARARAATSATAIRDSRPSPVS
jgi:hypothetical protein